ncbi:hypothetical protein Tco_1340726 [Tanacetum coccineum]
MNAIELQKQESMINAGTTSDVSLNSTTQEGKSSNPRINTDAEGAQISKDGSKNDNAIAKASHDKDNINAVQWSNNELFENVFAHSNEVGKTNEDHKALKEANDLLTKDFKMYKERL